jgi:deoxyribose-phosphate aldolase
MTKSEVASYIDHTLLAPTATVEQIVQLCHEANVYGFASVCVNPIYVSLANSELKNSKTKVCTVIGFPLGANTTKDKCYEAKNAIKAGADEIDMVIDISAAIDGRITQVSTDISQVVKTARKMEKILHKKIIVKVILETCFLDDQTIETCCLCAKKAGADFVKTSTGFATPKSPDGKLLPNGASEHHIKLMRKTVGLEMGVKASGGIRTTNMVKLMLAAGATRIGTSSGVNIIESWKE